MHMIITVGKGNSENDRLVSKTFDHLQAKLLSKMLS